jgi:prevent-host-death family protein
MRDARNHFSAMMAAARRMPQMVSKHGKPAVVIINAADYERLRQLERAQAPSFKDHLLAMPRDDGAFERMDSELSEME